MADARSRATEKYRKANVKSFNVKFFPADADILEYFQAKSNRNQYIKNLIRRDMEAAESPNACALEIANEDDVETFVLHERGAGSADAAAGISGTRSCKTGTSSEAINLLGQPER